MVWNDGSSLPTERSNTAATRGFGSNVNAASRQQSAQSSGDEKASSDSDDLPAQPKMHNEEDFLLANEIDIDASLSLTDTAGTSYLRPYSRVHLASKLDILAAPTLAIYHIPSRKLIERNVRVRRMQEHEREETWTRWERGEGAGGVGFKDALHQNKLMVYVSIISLAYFLLVKLGGEQYNVRCPRETCDVRRVLFHRLTICIPLSSQFIVHALESLGQQHGG